MPKPALGKGLGALIPTGAPGVSVSGPFPAGITEIELARIVPNELQPRRDFHDDSLKGLADSIREQGVIQPVLVRKRPAGGYELIAGERRCRAAAMAGLRKIPALIKDAAPRDALLLALIENIQREDLNPMETAAAYERLVSDFGLTQEGVSDAVGKERPTVGNFLRLLTLPPEIRGDLASGVLSIGHAKALLSLGAAERQLALRREIVTRGLSVREAATLAKRMSGPGHLKKKKPPSPQVAMLEDELKRALGTRVHIRPRGMKAGRIEIEYYSADELERLLEILRG